MLCTWLLYIYILVEIKGYGSDLISFRFFSLTSRNTSQDMTESMFFILIYLIRLSGTFLAITNPNINS